MKTEKVGCKMSTIEEKRNRAKQLMTEAEKLLEEAKKEGQENCLHLSYDRYEEAKELYRKCLACGKTEHYVVLSYLCGKWVSG